MIEFYLNGEAQRCASLAPDTSVLELLRAELQRTGTKEGCASGDCGACTVAIGEPDRDGRLHYHSINACITPAHQLQGRHLVTVEGLARGDALHPVQAAMVECHASQCGFCTPGIVMSLFTLHERQRQAPVALDDACLEATLGGNLCRCTGYRPIQKAARRMAAQPDVRPPWGDSPGLADDVAALGSLLDATGYAMPITLTALHALRRQYPTARLVAGATDLWLEATQRLQAFEHLIDVSRVTELQTIDATPDGWWIGASVTYTRLEPLLDEHYPAFARLLRRLGSAQIRNRGTLGGNIANASPIGDTPPILLALDAHLALEGPNGARQLPLDDFFLDYKRTALEPGEFIRAIFLPRPTGNRHLEVWKLSKRREDDISAVLGAFAWRQENGCLHDVHLAFGGMDATPRRAQATEAALEGQPPDITAFDAARQALARDFQPLDDVRGSAAYRQLAAANLLERLRLTIDHDAAQEVCLDAYAH
ncbi:xanthine dehydrogenase small subunit [Chromohalobacter marismortui]|uniref:Xanthine dehydrogenase small subunit n=1 Tax=Chromohalobacter marismortui TaxID=42055 RepID=A0A4R7NVU9_9GAMM|nr:MULTISPECIES: xanthine dehydrogenase small subunit [Chromohalobacter]MCI0511212.1 xanthine dehydrogenase small subunit [Chromohalobacter sp.]MCI0593932.1 xanthine dehydrogenase small subunit [Chromohalobacter sp.]TDU25237.1 xanthine dehydrogenase small subunit [Chromohalobacter marismortui]